MRRTPSSAACRPHSLAALLAASALALLVGCATAPEVNAWHLHLHDADRAFLAGDLATARSGYAALLPYAPERQLERHIRLQLALIDGYEGDLERAIAQLSALEQDDNPEFDEYQSRARLAVARLLEDSGQVQAALELYVDIVVRYPDTMAGEDSLERILDAFKAQDDAAGAVRWLAETWPLLDDTELGDNLLYRMARLFHTRLDDLETAGTLYQELRALYPQSPLRDDASLHLSDILIALGRIDEALVLLETLAGPHDSSWSMGEYDSKLRDDAMQRRAQLFESLGRIDDAIAEWARLLEAYPSHSEGGRLSWHRAELVRNHTGSVSAYREALELLIESFHHSIYADRARWRLELLERGVPLDALDAHPMPRERPWLDSPSPR